VGVEDVIGIVEVEGEVFGVVLVDGELLVVGVLEVVTPVPTTCRFWGMIPLGISSALMAAKPKRKAYMMGSRLPG
jgi:hypothetical protein